MSRPNRFYVSLPSLAVLSVLPVLFLTPLWTHYQAQAAKRKPYGRYSEAQVVKLAQRVSEDLVPAGLPLAFMPFRSGTTRHPKWQVQYTDAKGDYAGICRWDATTGLLEEVSQKLPYDPRSSGRLTLTRAAAVAVYWMEKWLMASEQVWRLVSEPEYDRGVWKCLLRSFHARALVIVRASDGHLLFAQRTVETLRVRK